jgi:hypothetical protein
MSGFSSTIAAGVIILWRCSPQADLISDKAHDVCLRPKACN